MFNHPLMVCAPLLLPIVFKIYDALSGFSCPNSYTIGPRRAKASIMTIVVNSTINLEILKS